MTDRQTVFSSPEAALCANLDRRDGHLRFAGQDTVELAKTYGTPLYLMDEDRIRYNCRLYREAFSKCFPEGSQVLYASKANSFREIYRICAQEDLGADVVSAGEILTAQNVPVKLCKTCADGRGVSALPLVEGVEIGTLVELAQWTLEADKVLTF